MKRKEVPRVWSVRKQTLGVKEAVAISKINRWDLFSNLVARLSVVNAPRKIQKISSEHLPWKYFLEKTEESHVTPVGKWLVKIPVQYRLHYRYFTGFGLQTSRNTIPYMARVLNERSNGRCVTVQDGFEREKFSHTAEWTNFPFSRRSNWFVIVGKTWAQKGECSSGV